MKLIKRKFGQSVVEYTILLVAVASVIVLMNIYLNRTVKGRFKQIEAEVNQQPVTVY